MTNELMDALVNTIHSESNNNPPPTICTITRVYTDGKHINAKLNNGDIITYVKTIGNPVENNEGVMLFLDGNLNTPIVIC